MYVCVYACTHACMYVCIVMKSEKISASGADDPSSISVSMYVLLLLAKTCMDKVSCMYVCMYVCIKMRMYALHNSVVTNTYKT